MGVDFTRTWRTGIFDPHEFGRFKLIGRPSGLGRPNPRTICRGRTGRCTGPQIGNRCHNTTTGFARTMGQQFTQHTRRSWILIDQGGDDRNAFQLIGQLPDGLHRISWADGPLAHHRCLSASSILTAPLIHRAGTANHQQKQHPTWQLPRPHRPTQTNRGVFRDWTVPG